MAHFYDPRTGKELMMKALKDFLIHVRLLIGDQTHTVPGGKTACIDLVEGQPVVYQIAQFTEQHFHIAAVKVDGLAILPAAVLQDQLHRDIIVQDGGKNLHAMLLALAEQIFIVADAFGVRLSVIAVGKQPGPADRGAKDLHAHFCEQRKVLLVGVIEVDAAAIGIIRGAHILQCLIELCLGERTAVVLCLDLFMVPCRVEVAEILCGNALAAIPETTVCLRTGNGTAPQKIGTKTGTYFISHENALLLQQVITRCGLVLLKKLFLYVIIAERKNMIMT